MGAFAGKYKKEDFIIAAKKAGFRQQEDLEKFELIYDYAAANEAPEAETLLDKILGMDGSKKEVRTQLADEMENIFRAAEKWQFVTSCEGWDYGGDKELLETAADARYNKDGSRNYDISGTLFSMMYRDLGDARSRGNKLDELRRKLEDVPEQNRSEAQNKALQLVEKQISRIPVIEECEKFAKAASGHGWPAAESTLRKLFEAGEGLPKDDPYTVQLENLRNGTTIYHDKMVQAYSHRQMDAILGKMKDALENGGKNTPAAENALREIGETQSRIHDQVETEKAYYFSEDRLKSCVGYEGEKRQALRKIADVIRNSRPALNVEGAKQVTDALDVLTGMHTTSPERLKAVHESFQVLDEKLPGLYREIPANHPAHAEVGDLIRRIDHKDAFDIIYDFRSNFGNSAPKQFGNAKGKKKYGVLPDEMNYLLSTEDQIQGLTDMFNTKKTGIFTSDSGTYTLAKEELERFSRIVSSNRDYIEEKLENFHCGSIDEKAFRKAVEDSNRQLKEAANRLRERMRAYAVHASGGKDGVMGDKKVEDVYRSAGAARYSGAMAVLEYLDRTKAVEEGREITEQAAHRVREVTFRNLFNHYFAQNVRDIHNGIKEPTAQELAQHERDKEAGRIRAAKSAQEEMERRIAGERREAKSRRNNPPQMNH